MYLRSGLIVSIFITDFVNNMSLILSLICDGDSSVAKRSINSSMVNCQIFLYLDYFYPSGFFLEPAGVSGASGVSGSFGALLLHHHQLDHHLLIGLPPSPPIPNSACMAGSGIEPDSISLLMSLSCSRISSSVWRRMCLLT